MDANECDINHLDAEVLLPPRKRLLAEFQCSQEKPSSSSPSKLDTRVNDLLKSYKNGSNMSPQEIAGAAGSAAAEAAKKAEAARAAAEEKAAIAAKAVAAAKNALDLVASYSEESRSRDKYLRKNKLKKHVPVHELYDKYHEVENCGADEELARRLHRAINSSPRISKHPLPSGYKNGKHKKLKLLHMDERVQEPNGVMVKQGKLPSERNGDVEEQVGSEGSNNESCTVTVEEKTLNSGKPDQVASGNGEAESSHVRERNFEASDDVFANGRKRGRIKQKKLPLSVCSVKDGANPKEQMISRSSLCSRPTVDKSSANDMSLLNSSVLGEAPPTWKCQDFKVSQCIKQNKVVQS